MPLRRLPLRLFPRQGSFSLGLSFEGIDVGAQLRQPLLAVKEILFDLDAHLVGLLLGCKKMVPFLNKLLLRLRCPAAGRHELFEAGVVQLGCVAHRLSHRGQLRHAFGRQEHVEIRGGSTLVCLDRAGYEPLPSGRHRQVVVVDEALELGEVGLEPADL